MSPPLMDPNRLGPPVRQGNALSSSSSRGSLRHPGISRQHSGTPSIGIRRRSIAPEYEHPRSSGQPVAAPVIHEPPAADNPSATIDFATRRRSSSEPRPYDGGLSASTNTNQLPPTGTAAGLSTLTEESPHPSRHNTGTLQHQLERAETAPSTGTEEHAEEGRSWIPGRTFGRRRAGSRSKEARSRAPSNASQAEYNADLVNLLDVIDPEVSTLSTLTNVQNSLFIPNLGGLLNRRPTYNLSAIPQRISTVPLTSDQVEDKIQDDVDEAAAESIYDGDDVATITSHVSESHYAVLPTGVRLEGWTAEEKAQLDDHVRHMLHSRRSAMKRSWKGFLQYVRRPLGFFVTLYAFLITAFGLAWVLFLIGWINLGERRSYIIDIVDQVLVALFAIMGDGLIPWRIVDTYHMIYIAKYAHKTWEVREKNHMPALPNHNDLPPAIPEAPVTPEDSARPSLNRGESKPFPSLPVANGEEGPDEKDLEAALGTTNSISESGKLGFESVLSPEEQRKLNHHQLKFSKSHTFYKPHATVTHHAFPLRLLIAIVVILDFHSIFQVALGLCTWTIPYQRRPFALTTVILCCSIACNITGGILISIGDRRTRKKDVRERMFRQELTTHAIKKVEKERRKTLDMERQASGGGSSYVNDTVLKTKKEKEKETPRNSLNLKRNDDDPTLAENLGIETANSR